MSENIFNHKIVTQIFDQFPDGIFVLNSDFTVVYVNPAFCDLVGYSKDEVLGSHITKYQDDQDVLTACHLEVREKGFCNNQETTFKHKAGHRVRVSKNVQAWQSAEGDNFIIVSLHDLTHTHLLNQKLEEANKLLLDYNHSLIIERQLHFDLLTNLPNRTKLLLDLGKEENKDSQIVLVNIDSFNELNSYYGYLLADELVKKLAVFIDNKILSSNMTLYKLSIDEFGILIHQAIATNLLEEFTQDLIDSLAVREFHVKGQTINLSIGAGIAHLQDVGCDPRDIIISADMALKLAKRLRKPYVIYDPSLKIKENYEHNLAWIPRLRTALKEDRLVLFYQPVFRADGKTIHYYESLVRIIEPNGDVIAPYHFLEISKKLKLYPQLTRRVVEQACEKFAKEPYCFSINLSIEDIADPLMSSWIIEKVKNSNPDIAQRIIFEIVESEGIQNYDLVNDFIKEVKKYGVKIAIDDFGSGYSNFIYIMRLDIDFIKIDGSIIKSIHTDRSSQVITETLVDFAKKLGVKVVAEFVADEEIYDYVTSLGIDSLQGYLLGKPEPDLVR